MLTQLFINWNVDPIMFQIGSYGLRWYSMGFLCAFLFGYFILSRMFAKEKVEAKLLDALVVYIFLAVLIGARLGHCLFYEPDYFCTAEHWLEIFLPFNLKTGQFTGYQGLASHGAAIGILLALWLYNRRYHLNVLWVLDRLVIVVALGGAFIRLGNLFNSEIYGVETSLPWGFVFERNGETVPKHPTQLYESFSYLIIFIVSSIVYWSKKGKLHNGRLFGWWLVALFGARLLIEFVKEDQVAFEAGMTLNMGQLLSLPFILGGLVMVWLSHHNKLPESTFTNKKENPKK
ncbi:MAG: prolipoprotein diacylglyceryl transferase [Bacteroidales bacterium]|nr:prolipoprotein diacylglyceryl transferase [Bacteroidales bacterium]